MEERNVKIVRDPRKSLKSIKLNNFKNLSVTWFKENAWKWNFITLLLLITRDLNLNMGALEVFLSVYIASSLFLKAGVHSCCF